MEYHHFLAARHSLSHILMDVGVVGFIGILLLMAGIESNPGPITPSIVSDSIETCENVSMVTDTDNGSVLDTASMVSRISNLKKSRGVLGKFKQPFKRKNKHSRIKEDSNILENCIPEKVNYTSLSDAMHIAFDSHTMTLDMSNSCFQDCTWSAKENDLSQLLTQDETQCLSHLFLSMCDLNTIPSTLVNHSHSLTTLHLAKNRIKEIDNVITGCKRLKELDISSNLISSIPSNIECLMKLENLIIYDNPLFEVPSVLSKCAKLKYLKIGSSKTKVIALELLEKQLTIDVVESYGKFLKYPQHAVLKDEDKVAEFVKKQKKKAQGMAKQILERQGLCKNVFCCPLKPFKDYM